MIFLKDKFLNFFFLISLISASTILLPKTSNAAGFALKEQSSSAQGTAFAGATAGIDDPSTIFFNPAGLIKMERSGSSISLSYIIPTADLQNATASSGAFGSVSGPSSGDVGQDAVLPASYLAWDYSDDLKFGLAITTPFGQATNYDGNWVGRYDALTTKVNSININPVFAYRINEIFSIGGGPVIQKMDITYKLAANCAPLISLTPFSADCILTNEANDIGYGYNLGLLAELDKLTLGLSYRSKIVHELDGDVNIDVPSAALRTTFPNTGVRAKLTTPESLNFGLSYEISDELTVKSDVQWTNWSRLKEITLLFDESVGGSTSSTVPQNWNDVWFFALGFEYDYSDNLIFKTGFAFDQSPIKDEFRTPRLPGEDRTWISLGFDYDINEEIALTANYTHIFVKDSTVNLSADSATDTDLNANYQSMVDIITTSFTYKF